MRANTLLALCFLVVILQGCQAQNTHSTVSTPKLPDPHHHVVDVNDIGLVPELAAKFKMVQVSIDPNLIRENITLNPNKSFRAFTTCEGAPCQHKIYVEAHNTGQTFEIQGLSSLPWRPFSDLVWITDDILVFDRWSQPHYGIHFAVDVKARKLVLATPFPDQLP